MTCSISIAHPSVGTDNDQIDIFFVGNLNEAGIQPGSTCTVEGCYQYAILDDGTFIFKRILTPRGICNIKGNIVWHIR